MSTTLTVKVWRVTTQGASTRYEVPRQASQAVLDIVTHIQRFLEPSLSHRFACRVGMCGSRAVTVNGKACWTCRTHVSKVSADGAELGIPPLSNLPVIKDLATDMSPFFDKWARVKGAVQWRGDACRRLRGGRAGVARARRSRCPHRVHRLRRLLRVVRRGRLAPRLPRSCRAEPRLDAGQRPARCAADPRACVLSPETPAATRATRRASVPSVARSNSRRPKAQGREGGGAGRTVSTAAIAQAKRWYWQRISAKCSHSAFSCTSAC